MKHSLVKSSLVVAGFTSISRGLGFVRDALLAYFLGAGFVLDAFVLALNLPNLIKRMYAEGGISQVIVPRTYQAKSSEEAALLSLIVGSLSFILLIVTGLLITCSLYIMGMLAPGLLAMSKQLSLSSQLFRLLAPYIAFVLLAGVYSAFLHKKHIVGWPAAISVLLNFILILVLLLAGQSHHVVYYLCISVSLAGGLQMLVLAWLIYGCIEWEKPKIALNHPLVKQILFGLLPTALIISVIYIGFFIDIIFASNLHTGNVSWLYYSERLTVLPISLIGGAIAIALLPKMTALNIEMNKIQLQKAISAVLILGLPAALGLYFFSRMIVIALFFHGVFTQYDVTMVSHCIAAFALGIPAFLVTKILIIHYFVQKKINTPFICACIAISVNILCNYIFSKSLGHVGFALATSLSGWLNLLLLYVHFAVKETRLKKKSSGWLLSLLIVNTLFAIFLFVLNKYLMFYMMQWTSIQRLMCIIISVLFAIIVYGILIKVTKLSKRINESRIS